jgi:hypothetical protein
MLLLIFRGQRYLVTTNTETFDEAKTKNATKYPKEI